MLKNWKNLICVEKTKNAKYRIAMGCIEAGVFRGRGEAREAVSCDVPVLGGREE